MNDQPLHAIPTHIITGFLGSGKTTAINHLLHSKPDDERWAVLINEFGQIGVDAALISNRQGVEVRELAGGCLCCALGPALNVTLATLIRRYRPQRLLIEPTGLGHPARIITTLQSPQFREALDLRAILCLLDPATLDWPKARQNQSFIDQLQLADLVLLNRTDLATQAQTEAAHAYAAALHPAKQGIFELQHGQIDPQWLQLPHANGLYVEPPLAHQVSATTTRLQPNAEPPSAGNPLFKQGQADGFSSYGWAFSPQDQFNPNAVQTLLNSWPDDLRIKAVIRCGAHWFSINRSGGVGAMQKSETPTSGYARVEILSPTPLSAERLQQQLCACLI